MPFPLTPFAWPSVLAAGGSNPLVQELGLCLLAAGFLAAAFERLRIPTIAALLVAGVVLGPLGLGLIKTAENVETIANLGLTLLLFVIGLEVNPRSLLASGRTLLLTGALQVPVTVAVAFAAFFGLSMVLGTQLDGRYTILYLALASAFSSTLLVVRFLQERRVLDTVSGRLAVGLLVFQDVWAIVVLALQPSFESPQLAPIVLTFLGIFLLVGLASFGARFVLPHVFTAVAKAPELVVSVALAWCFAVALTGSHLGSLLELVGIHTPISVSMEMGALIAGMTVASFPYHHEVAAKVSNLRDFFVTLFFVALGISIPVPSGPQVMGLAIVLSAVTVLLRYVVFMPVFYFAGLDRNNADFRVLSGDRVPRGEGRPHRRGARERRDLRVRDHRDCNACVVHAFEHASDAHRAVLGEAGLCRSGNSRSQLERTRQGVDHHPRLPPRGSRATARHQPTAARLAS
jgi:Kef-type K+ transport system membrane component KefB